MSTLFLALFLMLVAVVAIRVSVPVSGFGARVVSPAVGIALWFLLVSSATCFFLASLQVLRGGW